MGQQIQRTADESNTSIQQVHICRPAEEFQTIASCETAGPDGVQSDSSTELYLTRGGELEMPANTDTYGEDPPFAYQHPNDQPLKRTLTPDAGVGIGYFRHLLEIQGIDVDQYMREVLDDSDLDAYHAFIDSLTERQRKLRLIDLLEWRVEMGDIIARPYLNEKPCSWRATGLCGDSREIADRITAAIDVAPGKCYSTARRAALLHADNHRLAPRIEYVEGFALPRTGAQAIRHAWVEVDGHVVECTWPHHALDGGDAVYFGYSVPMEEVKQRHGMDTGGPIASPPAVVRQFM
jgi:hypothetical protein